jgi:hypothetical protein
METTGSASKLSANCPPEFRRNQPTWAYFQLVCHGHKLGRGSSQLCSPTYLRAARFWDTERRPSRIADSCSWPVYSKICATYELASPEIRRHGVTPAVGSLCDHIQERLYDNEAPLRRRPIGGGRSTLRLRLSEENRSFSTNLARPPCQRGDDAMRAERRAISSAIAKIGV